MTQLDSAKVILWAHIADPDTGERTNVAVCRYTGDHGFCLFRCDADWNVHSDTDHRSIDEATDGIFHYHGDTGALLWRQHTTRLKLLDTLTCLVKRRSL